MSTRYQEWHTGVEFDTETGRWHGFVEDIDGDQRRRTSDEFETRADAAVAASDLLTELREHAER